MSEQIDANNRTSQILAQLSFTAGLLLHAVNRKLEISDDGLDYLKGALALSHDLVEEHVGNFVVDKNQLDGYASDGVCPELRATLKE